MSLLLYSVSLVNYFDFWMLKQTYILGINTTWSCFIICFKYCWIHLLIFFPSMVMRILISHKYRHSYKVLSHWCCLISLWTCLWKVDIISSIWVWLNLPIYSLDVLFSFLIMNQLIKVLNYGFNFFNKFKVIQIFFYFHCVSFITLYLSRKVCLPNSAWKIGYLHGWKLMLTSTSNLT